MKVHHAKGELVARGGNSNATRRDRAWAPKNPNKLSHIIRKTRSQTKVMEESPRYNRSFLAILIKEEVEKIENLVREKCVNNSSSDIDVDLMD
jgi:hypothetical protein